MSRGVWFIAVALAACSFDTAGVAESGSSGQDSGSGTSMPETSASSMPSETSNSASGSASMSGTTTAVTTSNDGSATMVTASADSGTTQAPDDTSSSTGSVPSVLVDDGLVTRYYLDEAPEGQGPPSALDAAPDPLDLPIIYNPELAYTEQDGHRGLDWTTEGFNGSAQAVALGTKVFDMLDSSAVGTIEVVFDSDQVLQSNNSSRYLSIGGGSAAGSFALSVTSDQGFWFRFNDATPNRWGIDVASLGRSVVHLVLDTTRAEGDRAILYLDGVRQDPSGGSGPGFNETIDLQVGQSLVIGNTQDGSRAGDQRIFYAALYASALSEEDVANNAAVLLEDDDTP